MKFLLKSAVVVFSIAAFTSCRKEKPNVVEEVKQPDYGTVKKAGKIHMHFESVVDGKPLILDSAWYLTNSKDSFRVNHISYYVSNLVFHTEGGSLYAEKNSIHYINERDPSTHIFTVTDVPPGVYDSVTLMIGIDAEKTLNNNKKGPYDPALGMYMNNIDYGYMAAKFLGYSPQSLDQGRLIYHIGGYKGLYVANRTVGIRFKNLRHVDNNEPIVRVEANIGKFFYGEHNIRLASDYNILIPFVLSVKLADNYQHMFTQKDQ